jgi:hypothetical protein
LPRLKDLVFDNKRGLPVGRPLFVFLENRSYRNYRNYRYYRNYRSWRGILGKGIKKGKEIGFL